jgi:crotonobetainyl-CoA:carnitine CoA-transferase CaiB-like acyl-CoA transferase
VSHPLGGLRVVELATDVAGPYATKLLADAGAEVVRVEPPHGDPLRRWTACGVEPDGDGALYRFLNASKQRLTIDWKTDEGCMRVAELATRADVVVESEGLPWDVVAAAAPRTSLVSISPFGRTGPWRDRPATEFTLQAWAGATAIRGTIERPPIAAGGRLGEWLSGGYAAIGALSAVTATRRTGRGRHVDVSMFEVLHLSMAPFATLVASLGAPRSGRTVEIPSIEPAADGYVGFCTITNQQWRDFLVLIERGELADDAELAHYFTRNERRHEVYAMIHAWTRRHTVAEIVERATLLRIPVAPIGNGETVTENEQFRARGVYVPGADSLLQPRPPYRLGRGTLRPFAPASRLDEHAPSWEPRAEPDPGDGAALPFAGLRVLDFTMFWAGPFVGHFLATLGADVIKVESIQRPDGIRFASTAQPNAEHPWEWSGMFHGMNAGKRGITLDLSRPRGVELARALAARSDVLVENFSPRVLDNVGLRYDDLARENSGLVMVRMPAFGLDGPWRDRTGFAQTMEQVSGMAWVTGFADGPPLIPRGPCDPLAGMHAVLALLVALEHRRRTGEGQLVESTMVEAALNATADQVLERQAYGRFAGRDGNRGPVAAPQNLYACRGDEQWIAIAVVTDAQWAGLGHAFRSPAWATDPRFADVRGRRAALDEIDAALASACAAVERDQLVERLLFAGVPAAPVVHPSVVAQNPQVRARGFLERVDHPVAGPHEVPGLPMRFTDLQHWYRTPRRRSASTRPRSCASSSASTMRRSRTSAPSASSATAPSASDAHHRRRIPRPPHRGAARPRDAPDARSRAGSALLDVAAPPGRRRRPRPVRGLGQPRPRSALARRTHRPLRRARCPGARGAPQERGGAPRAPPCRGRRRRRAEGDVVAAGGRRGLPRSAVRADREVAPAGPRGTRDARRLAPRARRYRDAARAAWDPRGRRAGPGAGARAPVRHERPLVRGARRVEERHMRPRPWHLGRR